MTKVQIDGMTLYKPKQSKSYFGQRNSFRIPSVLDSMDSEYDYGPGVS